MDDVAFVGSARFAADRVNFIQLQDVFGVDEVRIADQVFDCCDRELDRTRLHWRFWLRALGRADWCFGAVEHESQLGVALAFGAHLLLYALACQRDDALEPAGGHSWGAIHALGAGEHYFRRAEVPEEIVGGGADFTLWRIEADLTFHGAVEPWIVAGALRPCAFVQSAEDNEVIALEAGFHRAEQMDTGISRCAGADGPTGDEGTEHAGPFIGRHAEASSVSFQQGCQSFGKRLSVFATEQLFRRAVFISPKQQDCIHMGFDDVFDRDLIWVLQQGFQWAEGLLQTVQQGVDGGPVLFHQLAPAGNWSVGLLHGQIMSCGHRFAQTTEPRSWMRAAQHAAFQSAGGGADFLGLHTEEGERMFEQGQQVDRIEALQGELCGEDGKHHGRCLLQRATSGVIHDDAPAGQL